MPVIRQRLQRLFVDQQQDVLDTRKAMYAFMAAQMHPVPVIFQTRTNLLANLSVDHALSYPDIVKIDSKTDIAVGYTFNLNFATQNLGQASLSTEQNLSYNARSLSSTAFNVTQDNPLLYTTTVTGLTLAAVTTSVALSSFMTTQSILGASLIQEAPLIYAEVTHTRGSYNLQQNHSLKTCLRHKACLFTNLAHEQALTFITATQDRSRYSLTVGYDLPLLFSHKINLKACLRSQYRLASRFVVPFVFKVGLVNDHSLQYKSRSVARFYASLINGLSFAYRTTTVARLTIPLKTPLALTARFRITDTSIFKFSFTHALSSSFTVPTRLWTPLRLSIPLRQKFQHPLRLSAFLQSAAPLKMQFTVAATLNANPVQVSFLRARIVAVAGFYSKLTVGQPAGVRLTAREIARLSLLQAHPVVKKSSVQEITRLPLKQAHNVATAFKHAPLLNALLTALYEPESYALFARMNPVPSYTQRVAINNYIKSLKASGAWATMDYLYIFAAANTANANINWVSSSKYPAVPQNSPTFTANKGYTFGGLLVASYIDSGLNPATGVHLFAQNSAHLYVRTLNNLAVLNTYDTGNSNSFINSKAALNLMSVALNSGTGINLSTTDAGAGPFAVNRNNAAGFDGYTKNSGPNAMTSPSVTPASANLTIGGGLSIISNRQVAAASAGSGMTTAQMQAFISQTDTLLSALGAI